MGFSTRKSKTAVCAINGYLYKQTFTISKDGITNVVDIRRRTLSGGEPWFGYGKDGSFLGPYYLRQFSADAALYDISLDVAAQVQNSCVYR